MCNHTVIFEGIHMGVYTAIITLSYIQIQNLKRNFFCDLKYVNYI